jgi:hypothetical protein
MTPEQERKIQFVSDSGIGSDFVRCPSCDKKRITEGRTEDLCVPFNSEADMVCNECGDVRLPYDCQAGTFDLEYPNVLPPLRTAAETQLPQQEQKKPESNCRDCVHRCNERVQRLVSPLVKGGGYFEGIGTAPVIACTMFSDNGMGSNEPTIADCSDYQQVSAAYILSTAATGKWTTLDILSDGNIRFVLPTNASEDDEAVCRAWSTALEACRTVDDSNIIWGAFVAKQVDPIPPSPIAKFPATASYIGEHARRYILQDGGKVLLQRHERGSGTLYVFVESASPGLLRLLRDTFAGAMVALMSNRAAVHEFCPQDPDFPEAWQPQIAICILSRTAAPVIYGALHGLPFPGEDSTSPDGERVDTKMRKVFTRELADSFPDPIAREIALASLAVYEAQQAKKGS